MSGWGGLISALCKVSPQLLSLVRCKWTGRDAAAVAEAAKEMLLSRCFRGKACSELDSRMQDFIPVIERCVSLPVAERMRQHIDLGHEVAVVSASVDVWIRPWAQRQGISRVIATQQATEHRGGITCYTGRFLTANCNGVEKVARIQAVYPKEKYHIIAYGNSRGDYPMLRYADEAYLCRSGKIESFI